MMMMMKRMMMKRVMMKRMMMMMTMMMMMLIGPGAYPWCRCTSLFRLPLELPSITFISSPPPPSLFTSIFFV